MSSAFDLELERRVPNPRRLQLGPCLADLARVPCAEPFAPPVLGFFAELSRRLFASEPARASPEIQALAFFLRRASLQRLEAEFRAKSAARAPRGTVFHVPPGNVETLFCLGWALSALVGNRNLVRLSPRRSAVTDVLVQLLNEALAADISGVAARTLMLEYGHEREVSLALSACCDVRVIWGGDATVNSLRSLPLPPRALELTFPDRLSYAALASERLLALGEPALGALAEQLFNDAYWFDQRACSSPRALVLCGPPSTVPAASARLLAALVRVVERRGHRTPTSSVLAKRLYTEQLAIDFGATGLNWSCNEVVAIEVPGLDALRQREHCGGGIFLLVQRASLGELGELVSGQDQTLTHFGFEPAELAQFARAVQGRGIDRIVPVGKALELSHLWDGYDLLESFSRVRDLRIGAEDAATLAAPARS
jgi:hypothetical protein